MALRHGCNIEATLGFIQLVFDWPLEGEDAVTRVSLDCAARIRAVVVHRQLAGAGRPHSGC